ncbi:cbb3-type cytochrome oxidase assembly protein CcoS [Dyella sp. RRB7]|uniref:cbb3-type cytochrome oxidase assembly protein CcoS n=1 Tax=Dyella sp. RRB7 TaxID=2919502 RepID=UPI001FAB245D|nr:cbb3-type cytochrome oxidase assembly protein CcoS [Dyella sp. RRB7]
MIILLMLIPLSLMLLVAAIGAFVWAVRKGQFDDMETPALDILSDDPPVRESPVAQGGSVEDGHGD